MVSSEMIWGFPSDLAVIAVFKFLDKTHDLKGGADEVRVVAPWLASVHFN